MPKKKIADLPEITTVNANDLFLVEQSNGKNAYIKKSNLLSSFASIDTFVGTTTWGSIQTQANSIFYRFQFISASSLPYRLQLWKSNDNKVSWTMDKEYNLEKLFLSDGTIPMTSYLQVERANSNYFGRFDSNDIDTYINHMSKTDDSSILLCINVVNGIDNDSLLLKHCSAEGDWHQYRVYNEYNKPQGYYYGDGTTTRTIEIGGDSTLLVLDCTFGIALVNGSGGVLFDTLNNATAIWNSNYINYKNGKLYLNQLTGGLNYNGTLVKYRVL